MTMRSMTITINPTLIPSPNPRSVFTERYYTTPPTRAKLFFTRASSSYSWVSRTLLLKCSNSSECEQSENGGLKDVLSGMVDDRVDELLNREENRVLLDGLEKATQRVEMAKRELAEIERQEIEAKQLRDYINLLETRTSEIAECQREILEAREMVEEAERSLNINSSDGGGGRDAVEIDKKDEERQESIKAAAISALVGTLAGLPISFTQVAAATSNSQSQLILPLAVTFVSCALFGVTFRYAVRRDLDNIHLKTGTSAAFGFVKGLATLDGGSPLEFETGSFLSHAFNGAVYVSENLLIFVFAAVGLDFCYKMRILSPFPIRKSVSKD
uniref:Homer protein n=1 Tax=Davidia involucrata TaxID=16924 RepID=A0A5B7BMP8_DAVIN